MGYAEFHPVAQRLFPVKAYDLGATLDSGQAFRWKCVEGAWTSVIGHRWVRLRQLETGLAAETVAPASDWGWLERYLQLDVDLASILKDLPPHPALVQAIAQHPGLRLLRQDPWECLASFILSSTKKITHIRQIVERLCAQYGEPVLTPVHEPQAHTFPSAARLATLRESDLRTLGMGFRAPYLLQAAQRVASGRLNLEDLKHAPLPEARAALMEFHGVGRKIADCVLLFSLGFNEAFPVDVWVMRALQSAWFPHQKIALPALLRFAESHFGRHGGYAQQYLFHHARTQTPRIQSQIAHENQG